MTVNFEANTTLGFKFTPDNSGIIQFKSDSTDTLTILANGNVGIKKTNPAFALDINGTVNATAINSTSISSTSMTVPTLIGGSAVSSNLVLQSTSGVGTTDSVLVKVGNNGSVTAATFANATAFLTLNAGTTAVAPLDFTAGTNLTSPLAGAVEYDGSVFYATGTTGLGRGILPAIQHFKLTAAGSAIGPTIANFFGASTGVTLAANAYYELEAELFFTKTTLGTATFTFTFSQAPQNASAYYVGTPVGGVGTAGGAVTAAVVNSTSSATALPVTGSLTTGVNHQYKINAIFLTNVSSGGTLNIQITSSLGTVTPLALSNYRVRRIPTANTGTFA